MEKKQKKKKGNRGALLLLLPSLLIGALCGIMIVRYADLGGEAGGGALTVLLLFVSLIVGIYLQTAVHEAGHLVFGLLSGYRFSSYRIGSLMLLRSGDKLRFCRLSIAGTGGQCLMCPPEPKDGRIPVRLYNLGGALANLFLSAILLVLYFLTRPSPLATALLMAAAIGFLFAATNGIPMRAGLIENDGKNAFSLEKNEEANRAFYLQLRINEMTAEGVRLRDMPEEWFTLPENADRENALIAAIDVFAANRLMDMHRFEEAEASIRALLSRGGAIDLHKNLLTCDLICLLLRNGRRAEAAALITKQQRSFMRAMKKFPTVIRAEYMLDRFVFKDAAGACLQAERLARIARHYPYPADIASERELLSVLEQQGAQAAEGEGTT